MLSFPFLIYYYYYYYFIIIQGKINSSWKHHT